VPESVSGGIRVHTEEVRALVAAGQAVLVDVLPTPPRPEGLAPGALWLPPVHRNIPGSAWLPNVGFGELSDELDTYFRRQLERLTAGDPDHPLVIYCQADCWMSWNAAKRAAAYGYGRVLWYPEGTTGWEAEGLALEKSRPVPME
jgi:PQQ-dependent catabolism-associated CXXCW motif protein